MPAGRVILNHRLLLLTVLESRVSRARVSWQLQVTVCPIAVPMDEASRGLGVWALGCESPSVASSVRMLFH